MVDKKCEVTYGIAVSRGGFSVLRRYVNGEQRGSTVIKGNGRRIWVDPGADWFEEDDFWCDDSGVTDLLNFLVCWVTAENKTHVNLVQVSEKGLQAKGVALRGKSEWEYGFTNCNV